MLHTPTPTPVARLEGHTFPPRAPRRESLLSQLKGKLAGTRGSEAALVGITMIWGTTFLVVHGLLTHTGPLMLTGMRFGFATLALMAVFGSALKGITRRELAAGALVGVSIFFGYALQAKGMETIPSSKSAFITALYVPLVPLLQWAVMRKRPHIMAWIGIGLAFAGLVLLAGPDGASLGLGEGEVLTLIATLAIAAEILLVGTFAGSVDVRRVSIVQLGVASLLAFLAMPVVGEAVPAFSWTLVIATCTLGIASALIQVTMNWAQKRVSPTRATVIYAGEPVWAGIAGRLAGERLPALAILGAALIVLGVIVSELRLKARKAD
ncbi:DMT family transporter [Aquabacter cavernae]|uniref:DMT family transporter n=1 Tax=Aquabacter cavernae TaxID=2496029 RepID=UPI00196A8920|nr:DMT family transporter [Aquabacter cavernae]